MLKVVNNKVIGIKENKRFLDYCEVCNALNNGSTVLLNDEVSLLISMLFCKGLSVEEIGKEINYIWKNDEIMCFLNDLNFVLRCNDETNDYSLVKKIG
jgi:hypothetical protein